MIKHLLKISLWLLVAGCGSEGLEPGTLASPSENYDSPLRLADAPPLANPPQKRFRSWWNRNVVSKWRPIGHMVHDRVEKTGDSQVLVGKFDYGTVHKDLENEDVHAYVWGPNLAEWQYLGEQRTNGDGKATFRTSLAAGVYVVKMVIEGDLSGAHGFLTVVQPSMPVVVFDIDGTLTAEDIAIDDLLASDYPSIAAMAVKPDADRLVGLYEAAGFQIFYLTARAYWLARPTRSWQQNHGMVENSLSTTLNNNDALWPTAYKTDKLLYLQDVVGLDIYRVYGNATTDIEAYECAGIPKTDTFIIGEHAGEAGTQPINPDYVAHADQVEEELGL